MSDVEVPLPDGLEIPPVAAQSDRAATQAELVALSARFEELLEKHMPDLKRHAGQYVVFNLKSGEYRISLTSADALRIAEKDFGSSDWCWVRQIRSR